MSKSPYYDPKLAQEEIAQILSAVGESDQPILVVQLTGDRRAEVRTGVILGPLTGQGKVIRFAKLTTGWKKVSESDWIS